MGGFTAIQCKLNHEAMEIGVRMFTLDIFKCYWCRGELLFLFMAYALKAYKYGRVTVDIIIIIIIGLPVSSQILVHALWNYFPKFDRNIFSLESSGSNYCAKTLFPVIVISV